MMTVLITGGAGYIGSIMVGELLRAGYKCKVLDRLFFGPGTVEEYNSNSDFELIRGDIRYFNKDILNGVDTVIDLAGISNDPACDLDPGVTRSINNRGCLRVAELAKKMGVKRYILSSSCSVYGDTGDTRAREDAPTNPVSLYASVKLKTEKEVLPLANDNFCVTVLRNGTVYGLSPRMRFDLVVNIMTLHAWKKRKIFVLGGGKQWRPNVHVKDVVKAFQVVMEGDKKKVNGEIFNVGANEQNHQVIHIANMIRDIIPYVDLEIVPDDPDKRNYNVCFDKIRDVLGYQAGRTVHEGIVEVKQALESGTLDSEDLRTVTLKYYKYLLEAEKIVKAVSYKGRIF